MFTPAVLFLVLIQHPVPRAEALVARLGSPVYSLREQASKQLLTFGRVGVWSVRRGLTNKDAEVAERCERLLPPLEAEAVRGRYEHLKRILTSAEKTPIPSDESLLRQFLSVTEDTADARGLYLEMYESHGKLLDAIELSDGRAGGKIFWQYLDRVLMYPDGRTSVDLLGQCSLRGDVALLWFLAAQTKLSPFECLGAQRRLDFPFFGVKYARTHLTGTDSSPALRKLLAVFLSGPRNVEDPAVEGKLLLAGFRLAAIAEAKEARQAAVKYGLDTKKPIEVRAAAMLSLMRIGQQADVALLSTLIADDTPITVGSKVVIGDVALTVCIKLAGLNATEFGLPDIAVEVTDFALVDLTHRDAARRQWASRASAGGKR